MACSAVPKVGGAAAPSAFPVPTPMCMPSTTSDSAKKATHALVTHNGEKKCPGMQKAGGKRPAEKCLGGEKCPSPAGKASPKLTLFVLVVQWKRQICLLFSPPESDSLRKRTYVLVQMFIFFPSARSPRCARRPARNFARWSVLGRIL